MKKAKYSLSIAINTLAQSYSMLILAIGLDDQHHSMRGRYVDTHIDLKKSYCTSVTFIHKSFCIIPLGTCKKAKKYKVWFTIKPYA